MRFAATVLYTAAFVLAAGGCSTYRIDQTGRRYIDQLVATRSIDRAVEQIEVPDDLKGKSFLLEAVSASSMEEKYLVEAVRNRLCREGMVPAPSAEGTNYLVRMMIKAAGVDVLNSDAEMPVPFATGTVSLYSSIEERGYAEAVLYFYDIEKGTIAAQTDPVVGDSYYKRVRVLFIGPITMQDIYEPGFMDRLLKKTKSLKKQKK